MGLYNTLFANRFFSRRMAIVLFLGFCSGLPLALTGGTLQAWMTDEGIALETIGRFALVGLPYTAKFLWSPLLDSVPPPFWGRRRGWAILIQIALVTTIAAMGLTSPSTDLQQLIMIAIALAFFSASQDIVTDAFRTELVKSDELGRAAGIYVMGYRLALLVSGAAALELAEHLPWHSVYLILAGVMALASVVTVLAPEPEILEGVTTELRSWNERITRPFLDFFLRAGAVEILLFVMIYKLSTMMATALTTPFLMEIGFSKAEIGRVTKFFGLIATIVGTLAGGTLLDRIGLKRALWIFGLLQATAGLSFVIIFKVGYSLPLLIVVIFVENFMMGLGVAALQGFMMSICSKQFTGTQFALLSSITAVSRVVLVSQAGVLVKQIGWTQYFIFSSLLAIPSLLLLLRFESWRSLEQRIPSALDLLQGAGFVVGLVCIASEPIWTWQGCTAVASRISWIGAVVVGGAVVIGVVPRGPSAARAEGKGDCS